MQLRDYQLKSHSATLNYINSRKTGSGVVVVPTGGGKSLLQAKLVHDYGGKALILSPTIEILKQNYEKFIYAGGEASIYSASLKSKEIGDVTYASLKSIKGMVNTLKKEGIDLLVIDECHLHTDALKGDMKTFIRKLAPKYKIGFTATPFRLTSEMGPSGYPEASLSMLTSTYPKMFNDYIHITQISELIDKKFWADIQLEGYDFNRDGLFFNSSGSDYSDDTIQRAVKAQNVNNRIYKRTKELMKSKKSILMFLDTVENCEIMANALGEKAVAISGQTKIKDREILLEKFKNGEIQVVCCYGTLVVGFDFPSLECVIMGRPTNSLAVFYQIYGRLVRPYENKLGLFIDYGGNLAKFGDMHNIVIENYRGLGHEVFYKDRMISGTPLAGPEITKERLDDMIARRDSVVAALEPNLDYVFTFGKYKDERMDSVPKYYLKWLLENYPTDNLMRATINHFLK